MAGAEDFLAGAGVALMGRSGATTVAEARVVDFWSEGEAVLEDLVDFGPDFFGSDFICLIISGGR